MTEARVGSLPWFAGVFWLGLSGMSHAAAYALLGLYDVTVAVKSGVMWLILRQSALTSWLASRAQECAREAGATEPFDPDRRIE